MKIKEIILDFTSLLDVTLIILFFFILFSHMETENAEKKAAEQITEAKKQMELSVQKIEETDRLSEQLKKELDLIREEDTRRGADLAALLEYSRGANVKMYLNMAENGWELRLFREGEVLSVIDSKDDVGKRLHEILLEQGYQAEDTLFFDFIYNGLEPGTASAYRQIEKGLSVLKREYPYLYDSETDISTGEEKGT